MSPACSPTATPRTWANAGSSASSPAGPAPGAICIAPIASNPGPIRRCSSLTIVGASSLDEDRPRSIIRRTISIEPASTIPPRRYTISDTLAGGSRSGVRRGAMRVSSTPR